MSYTPVDQNIDGEIVDSLVTPEDTTIYIRENAKEKFRFVQRMLTRYRHLKLRAFVLFLALVFILYVLMGSFADSPKGIELEVEVKTTTQALNKNE